MTEMVHGTMPAPPGEPVLSRWWRTVDRWTISCVLGLVAIGMVLALASSPPLAARLDVEPFYFFNRHVVYCALSVSVLLIISTREPDTIRRWGVVGFCLGFLTLLALPVIGTDLGKGSVRWLNLGFITVQPSEFIKPFLAVTCAWLLAAGHDLNGPPGKLLSLGAAMSTVALLAIQPDIGQSALVMFGWGVMYFVSGASMVIILGLVGAAVVGLFTAYHSLDYIARRIDAYLADEVDGRSQIGYATTAIQEGGLFGLGVGEGQVKWQLPDAHTDFVIAVAAEEYGFVLVLIIISLFAVICLRALLRLTRERDMFVRLAGTGLVAMISAQAMINLGVAARLLPAKGMTLPFISQGGSSLLAMGLMTGMLLALTRSRPQGELGEWLQKRGR
jgi:cell division protein FtsW